MTASSSLNRSSLDPLAPLPDLAFLVGGASTEFDVAVRTGGRASTLDTDLLCKLNA